MCGCFPQMMTMMPAREFEEQSNSGDDIPAEHDTEELRRKALEARKNSRMRASLLNEFHSGLLEEKCFKIIKLTDMAKA